MRRQTLACRGHSEEHFRMLVEGLDEGLLSLDHDLSIIYANPRAADLLGSRAEDLSGKPLGESLPGSFAKLLSEKAAQVLSTGCATAFEWQSGMRRLSLRILPSEHGATVMLQDKSAMPGAQGLDSPGDTGTQNGAEARVSLSEQKFLSAFESSPDPMAISDLETGKIIEMNASFLSYTGYTRDEVIGKTSLELDFWLMPENREELIEAFATRTPPDGLEMKMRRKDGGIRDIFFRASVLDVGGKKHLFTLAKDITDEKIAARKIREGEERLRIVSDNLPMVAIYSLRYSPERAPRFEYVSAGIERLVGLSPEKFMKDAACLYRLVEHDDLLGLMAAEVHAHTAFSPLEYEARMRHAVTGEVAWVLLRATPTRTEEGCTLWNGVMTDITRQKQAEQALRESEAKYRSLTETMNDVMWTLDLDLNLTYITPSCVRHGGFTPEENMAMTLQEKMPHDSLNHAIELARFELERDGQEGVDPDRVITFELEFYRKAGGTLWDECHGTIIRDDAGKPAGLHVVSRDITERKRAEQALKESEAKYRFITEKMTDAVWVVDSELRFTYISPSTEKLFGYTPEEFMARGLQKLTTPESYAVALQVYLGELEREGLDGVDPDRATTYEMEFVCRDGSTVWVENISTFIHDQSGKVIGAHGVSRDITGKKKAEELRRYSEQKFQTAFQASPNPMIITEFDTGTIVDANDVLLSWAGRTREEIIGKNVLDMGFWESPEERARVLESLGNGERLDKLERSAHRRDGLVRDLLYSARLMEVGGVRYTLALAEDVTDGKAAARALEESEAKFRFLTEKMFDVVWTMDLDFNVTYMSPSGERDLGYTFEELGNMPLEEKVTPETLQRGLELILFELSRDGQEGADPNRDFYCELEFYVKGGGTVWSECHGVFIRDDAGKPAGVHVVSRNITERKQNEELRRFSEQKFQAAFQASPDPMVITDLETGEVADANAAFLQKSGFLREEMIGKPVHDLNLWVNPGDRSRLLKKVFAGEPVDSEEVKLSMKDGGALEILYSARLLEVGGRKHLFSQLHDITEERAAAMRIRESEELLRSVTDNLPQVVPFRITYDKGFRPRFEYIGGGIGDLSGISPETALGDPDSLYGRVMPEDLGPLLEAERHAIQTFTPFECTVRTNPQGKEKPSWVLLRSMPARMEDGQITFNGVMMDVTSRHEMEETLQESLDRFRILSEATFEGIILSEAGRISDTNDQMARMMGCSRAELLGKEIRSLIPPEDHHIMVHGIETGREQTTVHRMIRKDGSLFTVEAHGTPLKMKGRGMRLTAIRDITHHVRTLEALDEARAVAVNDRNRLQSVLDVLPVGVCILNDKGGLVEVNKRFVELWGASTAGGDMSLADYSMYKLWSVDTGEPVPMEEWSGIKALESGRTVMGQLLEIEGFDGSRRFVKNSAAPIRGAGGKITGCAVAFLDITDLKKAEDSLRLVNETLERTVEDRTRSLLEANIVLEEGIRTRELMEKDIRRLAAAVEQAQDGIMLISADLTIEYVNPSMENLSGYQHAEVIGKPMHVFRDGFPKGDMDRLIETLKTENSAHLSGQRLRKKDGVGWCYFNTTVSPILHENGEIMDYVFIVRDITLEVNLMEQIRQIQRVDAVGAMAAGVAYDLKKTLAPLLINTRILMENIREDDPAHHYVGEILASIHIGLDLVDGLLTLSRKDMQEKKQVALPEVIRDAVSILKSTMPSSMIIRQELSACKGHVLADPVQIKQVLITLADNARKATRGKAGLLSIRLDDKELSAKEARNIDQDLAPGRYARIMVRDNGEGMDEDTRRRIFDPFFSTGTPGENRGMGLPVALGIVTGHKGAIMVSSSPGKGATFTVYLPVTPSGDPL